MFPRFTLSALLVSFALNLLFAQNPCDNVQVVAQATVDNITCDNPIAALKGVAHPSALSYAWSGPNGFSSTDRVAYNFVEGTYVLTVTGQLGCTAQTSVTVTDLCTSYALEPPECDAPYETVIPADECAGACVMPYLPSVVYNTGNYTASYPPDWCSDSQNDQWFAFVAGRTVGSITATPSNCTAGNGIQMALYPDCDGSSPLACNMGGSGNGLGPITINVNNLIIGKIYYLVVDGYGGDVCDFKFQVSGGICTLPPYVAQPLQMSGPTIVCPGGFAEYKLLNPNANSAVGFLWTATGALINGVSTPETYFKPDGTTVDVSFGSIENAFICARPLYYFHKPGPPTCIAVKNIPIPPTELPPVVVCQEELPYELPWGQNIINSGNYENVYISWLNCDSIVKQKVTVKPAIVTNLPTIYRCAGDCLLLNGNSYCEAGIYSQTLTSYLGCDSLINFQLNFLNPVAGILGGGTLTCSQTAITLSSVNSPGSKTWKNATGQLLGNNNNLVVNNPGLYILTVAQTSNNLTCQQADTILIEQDITPVQAIAQGGTLTCSSPTIQLTGSASHLQATLQWTGPNGFTANGSTATVSLPGDYYLTAMAPNGCSDTKLATVQANQTPPSLSTTNNILTCTQTSVLLQATVSDPQATLNWYAPNGALLLNPSTNVAGQYLVVATSANGCTASAIATITVDQALPTVVATGGTLTCINNSVQLNGSVSGVPVDIMWTGPNGFISQQISPTVTIPGLYILTATSSNGCQGHAEALVNDEQQVPPISLSVDSLNCFANHAPHIYATPFLPNLEYNWGGPHGFTSSEAAPVISTSGLYTVTVTNINTGCTNTLDIEVTGSLNYPILEALQLPSACGDSLLYLDAQSSTPDVQFQWIGPNSFVSNIEDPIVSIPGYYQVTTSTTGGCQSSFYLSVEPAPTIPQVTVNSNFLNCSYPEVTLQANADQPALQFNWSGPDGFSSNMANPATISPGLYQLVFTATNGCTATASTEISGDFALPSLEVTGGVLTCDQPTITLTAYSGTTGASFIWLGNNWSATQSSVDISAPGTYTVMVTAPNGCTTIQTVSVIDSCITGLNDFDQSLSSGLRLYPNASQGEVFVEAIGSKGFESLRIFTADGRLILHQEYEVPQNLQRFDLTNWPVGVYPISARIGSRWWTLRLVLIK